jgi:F0F1-type ATP synthase assembly protein I
MSWAFASIASRELGTDGGLVAGPLMYNSQGMNDGDPNPDQRKSHSSGARDGLNTFVQAERLLQIAFVLPAAVLIGWAVGALLDKWLHTHWIYIVGLLFGGAAGLFEAIRQAMHAGGTDK